MIRTGIVGWAASSTPICTATELREAARITALCATEPVPQTGRGLPVRPSCPRPGDPLARTHLVMFRRTRMGLQRLQRKGRAVNTPFHAPPDRWGQSGCGADLAHPKAPGRLCQSGQTVGRQSRSRKGATPGVFENVRQGERVRAAAWAVESGQIGDLQMALLGGIGGFWSPDVIVAETPWRHKKVLGGGGGAIDIGVHVMHMLRHVCGEVTGVSGTVRTFEPTRHLHGDPASGVSVEADVDDTYMATVTTAKGALAQMIWSWAGHGEATSFPGGPVFYGSKGCIKGGEIILDDGSRRNLLDTYRPEAP